MTGAPSNRCCCWFEYQKTPHRPRNGMPTLFRTLPTQHRVSSSLRIANSLFAHLVAARRLHFSRFNVLSEFPSGLLPQRVPCRSLNSSAEGMWTTRSAYLERPDETELACVFEYRSLEGLTFRNCVEDIPHNSSLVTLGTASARDVSERPCGYPTDLKVTITTSRSEGRREIPVRRNQSYEHGYRFRRMG